AIPPLCEIDFAADPAGAIEIDQLTMTAAGEACFRGGSLRIGDGQKRSKIKVKPSLNGFQAIRIDVDGAVDLRRVTLSAPTIEVTTAGDEVGIVDGTLKGSGSGGLTTIESGPGSVCDLSGTKLKKMS